MKSFFNFAHRPLRTSCHTKIPKEQQVSTSRCYTLLRVGITLNKMEFSKIVEENDVCLTDRRAVSNPITFNDRKVSMTFDGVSHIREPLSIILQVITDDRNTGQNLVCFQLRHHLLGRRQLTSTSQICNFCMGFNISHTTDHVGE